MIKAQHLELVLHEREPDPFPSLTEIIERFRMLNTELDAAIERIRKRRGR